MAPPSSTEVDALRKDYEEAGQGHVFTFYDELNDDEKTSLFEQLKGFVPKRITELATKALQPEEEKAAGTVEPLPASASASVIDTDPAQLEQWYKEGLSYIGAGKVAVVLMAGGQGTRLGSSDPKGCYDVGLPSHKSLFQRQAELISKASSLSGGATIPWYIMTSGPTRGPTEAFFKKNSYFGLSPENVIFFEQGVLPCISNDGKILLQSKSKVAVAPDGNGGIYLALVKSGVLADMKKRGIEHVHAYCVDNSLVRVADPTFIGFSVAKKVQIGTKVVRKRAANESVGLIISKNGKPDVVEYSEIDEATASAVDPENPDILKFRAANIVNHYYSIAFLESISEWVDSLPHHIAKKKIPYCDLKSGEEIKPSAVNGIKLEQFVFDVFPQIPLSEFACLEVKREDEFSPLKNGPDAKEDNPVTSRRDVLAQGKRWLEAVGATVENGDEGVEVSPLESYAGEGLEAWKGKKITALQLKDQQ
ncbi:nucleotide-diphospho-sugar transferase [Ascobolus immersus RN42]|uniref:UDP-N-acetylglucosamine diphosphorylase n=1 Tax=Ascobolus immersus RN42 TaxID=1160509 RepID=A0A3N4IG14_ASCIM|nr:nucleotide-diphospho-sugar transferase [Ascobolus immersus RN42]